MGKSSIEGKRVVLTGTFSGLRRADAEAALEALGAIVTGSVSKTTDILFFGADAGSKRAKAESLGVTVRDEAALAALLEAKQPSKKPNAKPAKPEAKSTKSAPAAPSGRNDASLEGLADELRAFVAALKKRKDVIVEVANVRRPAKGSAIANADIPSDLAAFYAVADGVEIAWKFKEGVGGGTMRILALGESGFVDDEESGMGFGRTKEAYLFDESTAEAGTWLVRSKGTTEAKLVFASAAEGKEGIPAATSIAEYVRKALAYGLVEHWPAVEKPRRNVSTAAEEIAIERYRGTARKPIAVGVSSRVSYETFAGRGRGEIVESRDPLVRLRLDDGREAWLEREHVRAISGTDAYEALRASGFETDGDVVARGERLARAFGTSSTNLHCVLGVLPETRWRAVGILEKKPFASAFQDVLGFWEAVHGVPASGGTNDELPSIGAPAMRALVAKGYDRLSRLDRALLPSLVGLHGVGPKAIRVLEAALPASFDPAEPRPLGTKGAAFAVEVRGTKRFTLGYVLEGLLGGLVCMAFLASAAKKVHGRKLASEADVARLERLVAGSNGREADVGKDLLGALRASRTLPHPFAPLDARMRGTHGLPKSQGVGLPGLLSGMPLFRA